MNATVEPSAIDRPSRGWVKILLGLIIVLLAAMWVYGLFFAPKKAANRIDDTAWTAAAGAICTSAMAQLDQLPTVNELRNVEPPEAAIQQRIDALDQANAILEDMVEDLSALPTPTDNKGQAIVPQWLADYRRYVQDRVEHTDEFRAGKDVPFAETAADGIPASERIDAFARDNTIEDCKVPLDIG